MHSTAIWKAGHRRLPSSDAVVFLTRQNLRLLKLCALILFTACLQASAGSYAQGITLKVENTPIEKVFKQITDRTGVTFLYNEQLIKETKPVTFDVRNRTLEDILNKCFQEQPLSYELINNTVVVSAKRKEESQKKN